MTIEHSRSDSGDITLSLKGDVTIYNVRDVFDAMASVESLYESNLVIDLSEVTELDTAGVQLFLFLQKALADDKTLSISQASSSASHIIKLLQLGERLALQQEAG